MICCTFYIQLFFIIFMFTTPSVDYYEDRATRQDLELRESKLKG